MKIDATEVAINMMRDRAAVGYEKYKQSINRNDLSIEDWCQHAIEEMLDGAQYLIRIKQEIAELRKTKGIS
jgi:hypothetical protein|tara:strand:- start:2072 stop:2284 length:213 start_codon:yes stop_codon:yes gene_type:complete